MCKKRIGVIFGGRSEEHDVSLASASTVIRALNSDKFVPVYIGITREGRWKRFWGTADRIEDGSWEEAAEDLNIDDLREQIDFALPIMHGTYGEDGCVQGVFEVLNIPYGGCGVMASAVAMDKQLFKEALQCRGLPVCKFICINKEELAESKEQAIDKIKSEIGFPCFVKPSNMGSSVGISKAKDEQELSKALDTAAAYDRRIIIEEFILCRELETGIIGNHNPQISGIGEIIPSDEFYDYEAKYSEKGPASKLKIPAPISEDDSLKIKRLALEAYKAIDCAGYARVDFFKDKENGRIYINEINTIPGFTSKSMFPLLWENCGKSCSEIIERIINLGYERYYAKNNR